MRKPLQPIEQLEHQLGLKPGFFNDLFEIDDWSFVIKLHALMEAACANLLMHHFKEPDLADTFSRMELSGRAVGKVVILEKLRLLSKPHRQYLFALSELRNNLVHDVRNTAFTFGPYLKGLDKTGQRNFSLFFDPESAIGRELTPIAEAHPGPNDEWVENSKVENTIARAIGNPKQHVWLGAYSTLNHMIEMEEFSTYKQWAKANSSFGGNIETT